MMPRVLPAVSFWLLACCIGSPADETAAAETNLGGKRLALHPHYVAWSDVREGAATIYAQGFHMAEIASDAVLLPEADTLRVAVGGPWLDGLGIGGPFTTNMGFMLVHRPLGAGTGPWQPVRCGDAHADERPRNPGFHVFDDETTIDLGARRIRTRWNGWVDLATCGVVEPRPRFAAIVIPWSNFGDMSGAYSAPLSFACDGGACPAADATIVAEEQGDVEGNAWLIYGTPSDGNPSGEILRIDPDWTEQIGSGRLAFAANAEDLAMSREGELAAVVGHHLVRGTLAGAQTLDVPLPLDFRAIGYGPGSGGERLLAVGVVGPDAVVWDALAGIGVAAAPLVETGTPTDVLFVAGVGWVVVAERGLFLFDDRDPGTFTKVLETDPADTIRSLAVGEGRLIGRDVRDRYLTVDPTTWQMNRDRSRWSGCVWMSVTSAWRQ